MDKEGTTPHSCLFTGQELGPSTKLEHTLPRGVGGRIRSRIVSSDEFNNKCGSWVDTALIEVYAEIIATLGPLLSREHRSGEIEVEVSEGSGRYALDSLGGVFQKGTTVVERDGCTGRPTVVSGQDKDRLTSILGQNAQDGVVKWTNAPSTEADTFRRKKRTICGEVEFAALKCALLAFDHVLEGSNCRFTRDPALKATRRFVAKTVSDRRIDAQAMVRLSMGLQYDKLPLFQEIRSSLSKPATEFEHMLVASANPDTRTLDLVWLIAGVDPFGFRVTDDWCGAGFVCVIVNEILRDGTVHGPYWELSSSDMSPVCDLSLYRAFHCNEEGADTDFQQVAKTIADHRLQAQAQAILLVEQRADDYVADCLAEIAITDQEGDHLIANAVRERLRRLFVNRLNDSRSRSVFDQIVTKQLEHAPAETVPMVRAKEAVGLGSWLDRYRAALSAVTSELGDPGVGFATD